MTRRFPHVAVINEVLAQPHWANEDPVGSIYRDGGVWCWPLSNSRDRCGHKTDELEPMDPLGDIHSLHTGAHAMADACGSHEA